MKARLTALWMIVALLEALAQSPEMLVAFPDRHLQPVLLETEMSHYHVHRRWHNPGEAPAEAVYRIPLMQAGFYTLRIGQPGYWAPAVQVIKKSDARRELVSETFREKHAWWETRTQLIPGHSVWEDEWKFLPPPPPTPIKYQEELRCVHPRHLESLPIFSGCEILPTYTEQKTCSDQNMLQYLLKEFKLDAKRACAAGTIIARFIVETDGQVSSNDIIIVQTPHPSWGEELKRIIAAMPHWTPAQYQGEPVCTWINLPLRICLQ